MGQIILKEELNRRTEFKVIGELEKELIMESGFTGSTIEEENK